MLHVQSASVPGLDHHTGQWESGYDESVEVNQRALIDKVLARYSGEFTGESLIIFATKG